MSKTMLGCALLALWSAACGAADLTATESRWLKGAWPVVTFAKAARIPLDVVVQPQPTPGASPMALAFVDGRCKLVLSMRGNPEAQATIERIPADLVDPALELMAAHELGHCRRYLDGAWFHLPAGFSAAVPERLSPDLQAAVSHMHAVRREEGYGDLVGLAWAEQRYPAQYRRLHAWLLTERARHLMPGSHHDTLVWLRLAAQGTASVDPSIFVRSTLLWTAGLTDLDH